MLWCCMMVWCGVLKFGFVGYKGGMSDVKEMKVE